MSVSEMLLDIANSDDGNSEYYRGALVGLVVAVMDIGEMEWSLACRYVVKEFLNYTDHVDTRPLIPRECIPDGWEFYFNPVMASETKEVVNE